MKKKTNNIFTFTNNIQFNGCLPNLLFVNNNILQLNKKLYYEYVNRKLITEYYNTSIYSNTLNYKIMNYNYNLNRKYLPDLYILDSSNILDFTESYIELTQSAIELLKKATFLLLQNTSYMYTVITNTDSNGIYFDSRMFKLDKNYKLSIYYSYSKTLFHKNKFILKKTNNDIYEIIKYEYNDFYINEFIIFGDTAFQVLGLNCSTNYYEILRVSYDFISRSNFTGYTSWGVANDKPLFKFPQIIYNDPLVYQLDTFNLKFGDYYLINGEFKIKM